MLVYHTLHQPQLVVIMKYSQLRLPADCFYLFIILKHKHITEIFVSSIPLYSN